MVLYLQGHDYHFELQNVCRLFLPQEKLTVAQSPDEPSDGAALTAVLDRGDIDTILTCRLKLTDYESQQTANVSNDHVDYHNECELVLCELLYALLCDAFGTKQEWGIVTGVRPVKLLRRLILEDGEEAAFARMRERLHISERKLSLCRTTLDAENRLLALSGPRSFSLYVSIPFCPSRCDYCSFVSQTVTRAAKLIPIYVDRLVEELRYTGELARQLGLRLETVYFGGGTPTSLTAEELKRLTAAVAESFDLSTVREYTVEAGRPDTVTADKMRMLKEAGVSRISINPQTLQETVLQAIGRKHTVEQFYVAFDLARRCGHENINTDLIAGLPSDTVDGFAETVDGILALSPESVTVHTLSMKRAANLTLQKRADYRGSEDAVQMVRYATERLSAEDYHPYYLYRQSRTVGNQENVGWARAGYEGLYNVYIMDETHTILGCGAGAVSKLKQPNSEYLERIFNYKFPYEYNDGLAEMLKRKAAVAEFYGRFGI